jgi:hypothetical protein
MRAVDQLRLGLALPELSAQALQRRAVVADGGLVARRVDLGDQLALAHAIADRNAYGLQLPRHLGADVDVFLRLQRPDRCHGLLDIAALHRHRRQTALGVGAAELPHGGGSDGGSQRRRADGPWPAPAAHGAPEDEVRLVHGGGVDDNGAMMPTECVANRRWNVGTLWGPAADHGAQYT